MRIKPKLSKKAKDKLELNRNIFKGMSPSQAGKLVDAMVVDLQSAKVVLKALVMMAVYLLRNRK